MYKYPDVIFHARFGDNCTDFVERIASKNDITIRADYFHVYRFKYITAIKYLNYEFEARRAEDLLEIWSRYYKDMRQE